MARWMASRPFIVTLLIAIGMTNAHGQNRTLTAEDLLSIRQLSDVQLSPRGAQVLFSVTTPTLHSPPAISIWISDISTLASRPLLQTSGNLESSSGRWSPDGSTIAFLSQRNTPGRSQIFIVSPVGETPTQLTSTDGKLSNIRWSPDGRHLAFLLKAGSDVSKDAPVVFEEPGQEPGSKNVLYVVDTATRKMHAITTPKYTVWDYDWAPNGESLLVMASDSASFQALFLWQWIAVISSAGGEPRQIVTPRHSISAAKWSPDGKQLAFLGSRNENREPASGGLFTVPADGGPVQSITEAYSGALTEFDWYDGQHIIAIGTEGVRSKIVTISLESNSITPLLNDQLDYVLTSLSVDHASSRQIALVREDSHHAPEVEIFNPTGKRWIQLSRLNESVSGRALGETEAIHWKSKDNLEIEGLLVKPVGYVPGTRYPLVVQAHAGPEDVDLNGFHATYGDWAYLLSAHGYVVLLCNYRGSVGRGAEFNSRNRADLGGKELEDILNGVDELVKNGVADPGRLGIIGFSYGGYLSAWATTQTDRFKAAIVQGGITDWTSFLTFNEWPYEWFNQHWGDRSYDKPELYHQRSPTTFVDRVSTPVLFIAGQDDNVVGVAQHLEFYRLLKFCGKQAQLVIYPHEGHELGQLANQLDAAARIVKWFDDYLKPSGGNPIPREPVGCNPQNSR
jgi:dipeptidyl aminopeptidase/acylaminoacyl peptidase